MRINDIMQVSNQYRPNTARTKAAGTTVQAREEYSPSAAAKDYHIARKALQNTSDIRQSLVDDITARLKAGTYNVSANDLAAAIIGE